MHAAGGWKLVHWVCVCVCVSQYMTCGGICTLGVIGTQAVWGKRPGRRQKAVLWRLCRAVVGYGRLWSPVQGCDGVSCPPAPGPLCLEGGTFGGPAVWCGVWFVLVWSRLCCAMLCCDYSRLRGL